MPQYVTDLPVLVVDDDDGVRTVLSEFLKDEGYPVATARNGQEALSKLRTGLRPCIILLDWKMPIMSGAEFRAEQKQDTALAGIPVAVISAHLKYSLSEIVDADVFLPKPLDYDRLLDAIAQFCLS